MLFFYYWLEHFNIVSIEAICMDIAQLYLEKNTKKLQYCMHILFYYIHLQPNWQGDSYSLMYCCY